MARRPHSGFKTEQCLLGHAITSDGKLIGSVYILAETRDVAHSAAQFGLFSAGILLVCFVIALLATWAMRGSIIRPWRTSPTLRVWYREKETTPFAPKSLNAVMNWHSWPSRSTKCSTKSSKAEQSLSKRLRNGPRNFLRQTANWKLSLTP